jgi:heat shock protein HtpX
MIYNEIAANKRNTWLLVILFILFIAALGYGLGFEFMGGQDQAIGFMGYFGIGAMVYALISYYASSALTLSISHAEPLEKKDSPELFNLVENLSIATGLPTPKIYLIEDTAPNAFATGRDPSHAAITVTRGLLEKLDKPELEGVLAHELSHIQNYDIRLECLIVALVGFIVLISDVILRSAFRSSFRSSNRRSRNGGGLVIIGLLLAVLSPIIAKLMNLAISRQREYLADASGALMTRYPEGLARALEKISDDPEPLEAANKATAHLFIANPLRNQGGSQWLNNLFSTHPPMEDRIKRLREMEK